MLAVWPLLNFFMTFLLLRVTAYSVSGFRLRLLFCKGISSRWTLRRWCWLFGLCSIFSWLRLLLIMNAYSDLGFRLRLLFCDGISSKRSHRRWCWPFGLCSVFSWLRLLFKMTAYSDSGFRLRLWWFGGLLKADSSSVDAGRLAFAQFFHDFVCCWFWMPTLFQVFGCACCLRGS